jgi:hypothetical protein
MILNGFLNLNRLWGLRCRYGLKVGRIGIGLQHVRGCNGVALCRNKKACAQRGYNLLGLRVPSCDVDFEQALAHVVCERVAVAGIEECVRRQSISGAGGLRYKATDNDKSGSAVGLKDMPQ